MCVASDSEDDALRRSHSSGNMVFIIVKYILKILPVNLYIHEQVEYDVLNDNQVLEIMTGLTDFYVNWQGKSKKLCGQVLLNNLSNFLAKRK